MAWCEGPRTRRWRPRQGAGGLIRTPGTEPLRKLKPIRREAMAHSSSLASWEWPWLLSCRFAPSLGLPASLRPPCRDACPLDKCTDTGKSKSGGKFRPIGGGRGQRRLKRLLLWLPYQPTGVLLNSTTRALSSESFFRHVLVKLRYS